MKHLAFESKLFHSQNSWARHEERLSRSKLKQAFLIDSDAELFMDLL